MAYVIHTIKDNSGRGEAKFYLYDHYREGKKVLSRYIRPASSKMDKPRKNEIDYADVYHVKPVTERNIESASENKISYTTKTIVK
jgi:hypothetical protein